MDQTSPAIAAATVRLGVNDMDAQIEQWLAELARLSDEEDRPTEKQLKILRAAVEIFAEKGYAATSTSEIAQKAGVAEGTIFRHYKTKKDLLFSIVTPVMVKLVAPFVLRDFQTVLNGSYERYEDFLRAVLQNRLDFAKKYAPVIKILVHEIPFHPELQAQFNEHVISRVAHRVRRIVEHFQERGQIIRIPPYSVIRLTATVILGYVFTRYVLFPDAQWNDEQEIEWMVRFITRGLAPDDNPHGSE